MRNNDKKGRGAKRSGGGKEKPYFSHDERDSDRPERKGSGDDRERRSSGKSAAPKRESSKRDDSDKKRSPRDNDSPFGRKSPRTMDNDRGEKRSFGRDDDKRSGDRSKGRAGAGDKRKSYGDDKDKGFGRKREGFSEERGERKSFSRDDEKGSGDRSWSRTSKRNGYGEEEIPPAKKRGGFGEERSERGARNNEDKRSGDRRGRPGAADKRKSYGDDDRSERKSFRRDDDRSERKSYGDKEGRSSAKKSTYGDDRKSPARKGRDFDEEEAPKKSTNKKLPRRKDEDVAGMTRLNKYIANAGICSRREADELIKSGVVTVNGKPVTEMGYKVKPEDVIKYNNETLKRERHIYVLLNKPKDYITTADDPSGRKTVLELVQGAGKERIYPVGRLDRATTGLLLLTNDGDLTKRLTHPKYGVQKIYHVELDKNLKPSDMERIMEGLELEDGFIKVDDVAYVGDGQDKAQVGVELHSGRNRIVRRIFEHLGYNVRKLDRVTFAGLTKKDLPRGRWRHLSEKEVGMLHMTSQKERG